LLENCDAIFDDVKFKKEKDYVAIKKQILKRRKDI